MDEVDPPIRSGAAPSDALGGMDLRPTSNPPAEEAPLAVPMAVPAPSPVRTVSSAHARRTEAPGGAAARPAQVRVQPAPTSELPLFVKGLEAELEGAAPPAEGGADAAPPPGPILDPVSARVADSAADAPLIKLPAEIRAPLGVRRKVGDTPAPRPARHTHASHSRKLGPLDRDLLEDLQRIEKLEQIDVVMDRSAGRGEVRDEGRAGAGKRAAAAALDALLMGGLATAVLAITLRWCDIPLSKAGTLPIVPTAAFLLLVGAGYLLMFTAAGGQTLGKMAFGIRVVGEDGEGTLTMKQAVYRSVLTLPSVLALGAGFVPALMGDERALHDRLAHTRVVRA